MAGVTGLEPAASGVTGQRSNQLSYTPAVPWGPFDVIHRAWPVNIGERPWPRIPSTYSAPIKSIVIAPTQAPIEFYFGGPPAMIAETRRLTFWRPEIVAAALDYCGRGASPAPKWTSTALSSTLTPGD